MSQSLEPRFERLDPPADGVVLLEFAGELDLAVGGRISELVDEVAAENPSLVVIDVAEVSFMDSTMLRELLQAHKTLEAGGAHLIVAAPQPAVRRLLELTGTNEVFSLTDSREAALS
jgi:anti-sigma B factor antagonist